MPQCSSRTQRAMELMFPGPIWDTPPMQYLLACEYGFTRGGLIVQIDGGHPETPEEIACIDYLCGEWDYVYESLTGRK